MVSKPEEGIIKEMKYADNNTTISDSTLRNIFPHKLKKMSEKYKVMCCCECCIYAKIMHSLLISWCDTSLKKLKYLSQNDEKVRSGEKSNLHI